MDSLIERYVYAVGSYFHGRHRDHICQQIRSDIEHMNTIENDTEKVILSFGHPKSLAYSYGYRDFSQHVYNPRILNNIKTFFYGSSVIYLFLSILTNLYRLNSLPFQTSIQTDLLKRCHLLFSFFSYPFLVIVLLGLFSIVVLFLFDYKYPVEQTYHLTFTKKELYELPSINHYSHRDFETCITILFALYFFIYTLFFHQDIIMKIQNESYQMIHLMINFFQPYILMIFIEYIYDMSKRTYSKRLLRYSHLNNFIVFISISFFIYKSHFLSEYLLTSSTNIYYVMINFFIIFSFIFIYFMLLYKILRGIKARYTLIKK